MPVSFASALSGVSRRTLYNWMERDFIHWHELPSGRRLICEHFLNHQDKGAASVLTFPQQTVPKRAEV